MKLNFNANAMKTLRTHNKNFIEHSKSIKNISTGKKIVKAKDNPNSVSKLGNIEKEIRSHQASQKNIQDAVSMIQSADSVIGSISDRISRVRELAIGLGNGAIKDSDKAIIQSEVNSLIDGIDFDVKNFSFNSLNMIGDSNVIDNSKPNSIKFLSTGMAGDLVEIPVYDLSAKGIGINDIDFTKQDIDTILNTLDIASSQVLNARTNIGALGAVLEEKVENSKSLEEVLISSKSEIEDADVALEMVEFTRTLILTEANIKNISKTIYFPNDMINVLGKLYK